MSLFALGAGVALIVLGLVVLVAIRRDDRVMPHLYPPLWDPDGGRRGD